MSNTFYEKQENLSNEKVIHIRTARILRFSLRIFPEHIKIHRIFRWKSKNFRKFDFRKSQTVRTGSSEQKMYLPRKFSMEISELKNTHFSKLKEKQQFLWNNSSWKYKRRNDLSRNISYIYIYMCVCVCVCVCVSYKLKYPDQKIRQVQRAAYGNTQKSIYIYIYILRQKIMELAHIDNIHLSFEFCGKINK